MGVKAETLLTPPSDLASRELPLSPVSGLLYRVHRINSPALYFGRTGRSRFDDPLGKYGVIYAALKPEAAFAETSLRQLSRMLIEEKAPGERVLSVLAARPVSFVNLTGHGLRLISCDNRIADELPYDTPRLWSRALYEHPQKPAGILYRSRHNPQFTCVAVFSSFEKHFRVKKTTGLLDAPLRAWTGKQLSRYRLPLV